METIFQNIATSWQTSYDNHIFIERKENETIIIDGLDNKQKTYYFEKSENLTIHINTKINHLVLNKCDNTVIHINIPLISGIDIFHSNNIIINHHTHKDADLDADQDALQNDDDDQGNDIQYSINFGNNFLINLYCKINITICVNIIYLLQINKRDRNNKERKFVGCLNLFRFEPIYLFVENSDQEDYADVIQGYDTVYGKFTIQETSI